MKESNYFALLFMCFFVSYFASVFSLTTVHYVFNNEYNHSLYDTFRNSLFLGVAGVVCGSFHTFMASIWFQINIDMEKYNPLSWVLLPTALTGLPIYAFASDKTVLLFGHAYTLAMLTLSTSMPLIVRFALVPYHSKNL